VECAPRAFSSTDLAGAQEGPRVFVRGADQGRALPGIQEYRSFALVLGVIGQGLRRPGRGIAHVAEFVSTVERSNDRAHLRTSAEN